MARKQLGLFGADPGWPAGFRYQAELVDLTEEESLLQRVKELPFKEFEFQGFVGKRRTVSYGWHYDFNDRALKKAEDIPDFLLGENAARSGACLRFEFGSWPTPFWKCATSPRSFRV